MKEAPHITRDQVKKITDVRFLRLYDLQYAEGRHYYDVSRCDADGLAVTQSEEDFRERIADAVSIFLILRLPGKKPQLLLTREFRFPIGRDMLSIPAGLIDPKDKEAAEPLLAAAAREIFEETGLTVGPEDRLFTVNPLLFSSPGMTDESNALICAVLDREDLSSLTQDGAEETECFGGFLPVDEDAARALLKEGRDDHGRFLPIFTWCALMYFLSGMWEK